MKEEVPCTIIRRAANLQLTANSVSGVVVTTMAVNYRKRALNLHYGEAETINSLKYVLDNEFSKVIVEYDLASKNLNSAFVIISTPELLDKLATWGKKCVMMDSTHNTNKYKLKLTTLSVRRPNGQFLVVAFCLSPKEDTETIKRLFAKVLPGGLNTDIFMSDMANTYYNAWMEVVGNVVQRRICIWHVHTDKEI